MAQGTTDNPNDPARQAPMGAHRAEAEMTASAEPVLFEDIDPVLLAKLYPAEVNLSEARARAMEDGNRVREEGRNLIAAQQEPIWSGTAMRLPSGENRGAKNGFASAMSGWIAPVVSTSASVDDDEPL